MRKPTAKQVWEFAEKVHPVYVMVKWHWRLRLDRPACIPSVKEIADEAQRLIDHLHPTDCVRTLCGGLFAEYDAECDEVDYGFQINGEL